MANSPKPGLIIANFDCELQYAKDNCPGTHRPLPLKVKRVIAQLSRILKVLGHETDTLWTILDEPWQRNKTTFERVLPWGQVSGLPPLHQADSNQSCWQAEIWSLRCTSENAAASANDRRLCQSLNIAPQWSIDSIQTISTMQDFDQYLQTAPLGPENGWVVKAPFAASGRERVVQHGRQLQGELRVRVQRLLNRYGQMVIEPWLPRAHDFGTTGIIGNSLQQIRIFPTHQLLCDNNGVFRGIQIDDLGTQKQLGPQFTQILQETTEKVANRLFMLGYRGAFGVDSFTYTDPKGALRLQSLCEINARLSFGLIARAEAEKRQVRTHNFSVESLTA